MSRNATRRVSSIEKPDEEWSNAGTRRQTRETYASVHLFFDSCGGGGRDPSHLSRQTFKGILCVQRTGITDQAGRHGDHSDLGLRRTGLPGRETYPASLRVSREW